MPLFLLIEEFNAAVERGDDNMAIGIVRKIEQRQLELRNGLMLIEAWEKSPEYNHIWWEQNRRNANNITK
jgi:hypothetical protein